MLVTVPLGVLKAGSIAFDPPLPQRKQEAIQRMGFGVAQQGVLSSCRASGVHTIMAQSSHTSCKVPDMLQMMHMHDCLLGTRILMMLCSTASAKG